MWGSEAVTSIGGGSGSQSFFVTAETASHHPYHLYAFHAPKTQIEKMCYLHLIIKSVLRTYIETNGELRLRDVALRRADDAYRDTVASAHRSTCHGVCINAYNNVDTRERESDRPCQSRGSSSARCHLMAHSGVIARQPELVSEELSE